MEQKQTGDLPAMVTPLGYPELTVTAETVRGHVVRHPPGDLHTDTHTHRVKAVILGASNRSAEEEEGSWRQQQT